MHTHLEFLRKMFVLESVGLVVLAPFWEGHFFVKQDPLFQKLEVILSVSVGVFSHVFDVLFDIDAFVLFEVAAVEDLPGGLFSLLIMDHSQLMHFLEMFSKHFSLQWCHASQKTCRVAGPNLTLFHFNSIEHHSSSCHEPSGVDSGVTDSGSHRYV